MTCTYCGSRLGEGEHRCRKCGRRPGDSLSPVHGALAAQPRLSPRPAEVPPAEAPKPPDFRRATQRQLAFPDKPNSNVIPFTSYVGGRAETPSAPKTQANDGPKAPRRRRPAARPDQGQLDFLPAATPKPRTLGTTVDAMVLCEAPVATRLHRSVAAALDWSLILIGFGLFLAAYRLAGGQIHLAGANLPFFGGGLLAVAVAYGVLWAMACTETPGMRWTRLRLITFDGFPPDRRQRWTRFIASAMSLCTVVGLLWSLADEESLTWQDHMSRTFPTPRDASPLIRRR